MTALATTGRGAVLAALVLALAAPGCGDAGADGGSQAGFGSLELALESGASAAGWFRLRVLEGPVTDAGVGKTSFDTGCVEALSRTYELTNIPVGDGRAILFEGFDSGQCGDASRVELGYRGDVTIEQNRRPYYHVPVYATGAVSALPEEINISAAVADPIDFCDADADCGKAGTICYDAAKPDYWCVPTCLVDSDCTSFHPAATCDQAAGWCVLLSPFPLNLSEPRAFGAAATLSTGSVAFIGGFGAQDGALALTPVKHLVEVFDQATGLFQATQAAGVDSYPGGLFGFAALGGDRFALAGGVSRLSILWDAQRGGLAWESTGWSDVLSDALVVVSPLSGTAKSTRLPRKLAEPLVVALDSHTVLVAGGLVGDNATPSSDAWICDVDSGAECVGLPPMTVPRAGAAGTCLDAGCTQVLVVGGASQNPLTELFDRSGAAPVWKPLTSGGFGGALFDPQLCGLDLVGGSTGRGVPSQLPRYTLAVSGDSLTATPAAGTAAGYLSAVAESGGHCVVAGGLVTATDRVSSAVSVLPTGGGQLTRARFGAAAAFVTHGALAGRALIGGGLAIADPASGALRFIRGVEVWSP
ncbi:MAG: hypothetical protein H6745_02000 [Deltaproteobacteria bacterium]|nr:hypothetical protein [Deltaproteobacteria bacterium]